MTVSLPSSHRGKPTVSPTVQIPSAYKAPWTAARVQSSCNSARSKQAIEQVEHIPRIHRVRPCSLLHVHNASSETLRGRSAPPHRLSRTLLHGHPPFPTFSSSGILRPPRGSSGAPQWNAWAAKRKSKSNFLAIRRGSGGRKPPYPAGSLPFLRSLTTVRPRIQ